jgi:hypothetical protein
MKTHPEQRWLMPRVLPFLIARMCGRTLHPLPIVVRVR